MIEKTWMKVIRNDIDAKGLDKYRLLDRNKWTRIIYVLNPA